MKILVVNGSPKGQYSVTLQTVLYLQKKYSEHSFEIIDAGQRIKSLEKEFSGVKNAMEDADAIIFSYPVYTFLAPSQLHRFIELVKEHEVNLQDKYVTQISTSKHFFDITAHKYIEENVLDLNMKYIKGLSADMEDLLSEKGQQEAEKFFERFVWSIKEDICLQKIKEQERFCGEEATIIQTGNVEKSRSKDVLILTDNEDNNSNLYKMIQRFQAVLPYESRVVNISEMPLEGGCLGCFRCAVSEKCVYSDGFDQFLREDIQKASAIVTAFTISNHSMGSKFKMYDDRNFCNGHRAVTAGMVVGYLISGKYSEENNLRTVIEARAETSGNFLVGVATDEKGTDKEIDNLAKRNMHWKQNRLHHKTSGELEEQRFSEI